MSDVTNNPYEAPKADVNAQEVAVGPSGSLEDALAGRYNFEIGDVMREAWSLTRGMKASFWGAAVVCVRDLDRSRARGWEFGGQGQGHAVHSEHLARGTGPGAVHWDGHDGRASSRGVARQRRDRLQLLRSGADGVPGQPYQHRAHVHWLPSHPHPWNLLVHCLLHDHAADRRPPSDAVASHRNLAQGCYQALVHVFSGSCWWLVW